MRLSVDHIQQLVDLYDRTAEVMLLNLVHDPQTHEAVSKTIDLFRMVNTGNLEWRYVVLNISVLGPDWLTFPSLIAKRYDVSNFIQDDGRIELCL